MKFQTLKNAAKRLGGKLEKYVSISIDYSIHKDNPELRYNLYVEHEGHQWFETSQELHKAVLNRIKNIGNPIYDQGITDEI